jgi:hypothetical protein
MNRLYKLKLDKTNESDAITKLVRLNESNTQTKLQYRNELL